jgi:flagellar hook assembly protein FlgD
LKFVYPENPEPWYGPVFEYTRGGTYPEEPIADNPYPNPSGGSVSFGLDMPRKYAGKNFSDAHVIIYNILGQRVADKNYDNIPPGRSEIRWDGTDDNGRQVSNGIYFYKLSIGGKEIKKGKLLRMK